MAPLIPRRLSDIKFIIDKDLNVKGGNRSFLRLLHKTDFNINISYILEEADAQNFKYFLSNFDDSFLKRSFLASIKPFENYISCIFTVTKEGELFTVIIEELSYSRQLLDKALLESREFTALMQNFDSYYFTYDGKKFTLKNTKDLITIFEGPAATFREYFSITFSINTKNEDSVAQLDSMISGVEEFKSGKYYTLFQTNKKILTVHTLKTSTRSSVIIVGSINFNKDNEPLLNTYAECRDGLTGLYNKKAITEMAVKKIGEEKMPCTLIILDTDKFKECNDTYGHIFGDRVLVTVANCINEAIKGRGIAGRIGGDEFLILLDVTEEEEIRAITRSIRTGIQWNITNVEPGSIVTCSMGIARFPENASTYEELFELADKSLYIAKSKGRNCYVLYKPELHDKIIIENEQNDDRISTGKFFMDCAERQLEIINAFHKIKKSDKSTVEDFLELVRNYIPVSKITVYDKNLKLKYSVGEDKIDFRKKSLANPEKYFQFFNDYGFLHLDNTNVYSSINGDRYEMYKTSEISSTIEYILKDQKKDTKLFICYDVYKHARTFQKDKILFAILVAKKLAEIL